jgi:hypothetical protein
MSADAEELSTSIRDIRGEGWRRFGGVIRLRPAKAELRRDKATPPYN